MNSVGLFSEVAYNCSREVTKGYSTSFFSAIKLLGREVRQPVHSIYGMVRLADEIVDTFHDYNKRELLQRFEAETYQAIDEGISLNPVLHCFQETVNRYGIDRSLIDAFFQSMRADLVKTRYLDGAELKHYVYGSAESVGLMCLHVFTRGDRQQFEDLKEYAKALGAAFQKINFLRDLKSDVEELDRSYFPGLDPATFTDSDKRRIVSDIEEDLRAGYEGIKRLPLSARLGVYVAYRYYLALFRKLKDKAAPGILEARHRIPNHIKLVIVLKAGVRHQLNWI